MRERSTEFMVLLSLFFMTSSAVGADKSVTSGDLDCTKGIDCAPTPPAGVTYKLDPPKPPPGFTFSTPPEPGELNDSSKIVPPSNVIIMPTSKSGDMINLNDALKENGITEPQRGHIIDSIRGLE